MQSIEEKRVKEYLENVYDIPFSVQRQSIYHDCIYEINPKNNNNELFGITIKIKDRLRIIMEAIPQKYSAFSIMDMSNASIEKKTLFVEYAAQLTKRKAKIDFSINNMPCNALNYNEWPGDWKSYRLRVSRSPICAEDEDFCEVNIVTSWAVIIIGMLLSLLNIIQIEDNAYEEGGVKKAEINRYERNPLNRELCLAAKGYTCKICGFNFEEHYGELGHHFIHVHHIIPISYMSEAYTIDPLKDLIPVCPNCHAMLHRKEPPLHPEELKSILGRSV